MIEKNNTLSMGFFWLNEPAHEINNGKLFVSTTPGTDFWQKTFYGFERDNGHCLLTKIAGDFSIAVKTEFYPKTQYDQCGLMVRIDSGNWIKASVEYETADHSRLGSVVTNLGYSDWATIDVRSRINEMSYRIQSKKNDFKIEYSADGETWNQLRIAHLHAPFTELNAGIYACSPMSGSFDMVFSEFELGKSQW